MGLPRFFFHKTLRLVAGINNANRNTSRPQQASHETANTDDDRDGDSDDGEDVPGPRTLARTELCKTART